MDLITKLYLSLYNATHDEEGQGMTEYAILLAVIVVVVIATVTLLGDSVQSLITDVFDNITLPTAAE